jgi:hypothetical protein
VTSDAPAPPESGTVDAPADAAVFDDYAWDANACSPGAVQTFHPTAYVPAAPQNACTPQLIDEFYLRCLGPGRNAVDCARFQTSSPQCYGCLLTPNSAATYGPVIRYSGFVEANIAGCIELASRGALGCAESVQALQECDLAACQANCPVSDSASLTQFEGCATEAEMTVCKPYAASAACMASEGDAGPLAACSSTDFGLFYKAAAPLFCAALPEVADAASD